MTTVESCRPLKRTKDYGDCWLGLMAEAALNAHLLKNTPFEEKYTRNRLNRLVSYLDQLNGSWVEISYLVGDEHISGKIYGINPDGITCSVKPPKNNLQIISYGSVIEGTEEHSPYVAPAIILSSQQAFKYRKPAIL